MNKHNNNTTTEYFYNFASSDALDPITSFYVRENDLSQEYQELDARYTNWAIDSCCPDYEDNVTPEEAYSWADRMDEIEHELKTLLDDTGVTKEEYKEAKKNLY